MMHTRWAVLGPGAISADFTRSLLNSKRGTLHAVGSSSPDRAGAFAAERDVAVSGSYAEILERDDIDAVYVGTVHTAHADLAIAALEAGKAVLCEKPVTATSAETERVLAAAARTRRPFVEAFKYRFTPLSSTLQELVADGAIGRPQLVEAAFGFAAGSRTGRLFDPAVGGGAILDVGCYPVSLAVAIAAWGGFDVDASTITDSHGDVEVVDETASATFDFGGMTAAVRTSIVEELPKSLKLRGTEGEIEVPDVWGGRAESATTLTVRRGGEDPVTVECDRVDPMAAEADAVSAALAEGRVEVPEMTWAETASIARMLGAWRSAVGPSGSVGAR